MKSLMLGICLFVGLVYAVSHGASTCSPAKQFRGDLQLFYYNINTGRTVPQQIKIAYDEINQRVSIKGVNDKRVAYALVQRFKEGKQYLVLGKYCLSMPVNGTFKKIEIPSSAQKVGEGRIGTAGFGVDFKRYSGVVRSGDKTVMFIAVVTVAGPECVFSSSIALNQKKDNKEIYYSSLSDITLGVDDSSFALPGSCHDVSALPLPRGTVETLGGILGF